MQSWKSLFSKNSVIRKTNVSRKTLENTDFINYAGCFFHRLRYFIITVSNFSRFLIFDHGENVPSHFDVQTLIVKKYIKEAISISPTCYIFQSFKDSTKNSVLKIHSTSLIRIALCIIFKINDRLKIDRFMAFLLNLTLHIIWKISQFGSFSTDLQFLKWHKKLAWNDSSPIWKTGFSP